jgi:hypothetical protein
MNSTSRLAVLVFSSFALCLFSCDDDPYTFDELKPLRGTWQVEMSEYPSYQPLQGGTMTLDDTHDAVAGHCMIGEDEFSIIHASIALGVGVAPSRLVLTLKCEEQYYSADLSLNEKWDSMEGVAFYFPDTLLANSSGRWLRAIRVQTP